MVETGILEFNTNLDSDRTKSIKLQDEGALREWVGYNREKVTTLDRIITELAKGHEFYGDIDLRNDDIHLIFNALIKAGNSNNMELAYKKMFQQRDITEVLQGISNLEIDEITNQMLDYLYNDPGLTREGKTWNQNPEFATQNRICIARVLFRLRDAILPIPWVSVEQLKQKGQVVIDENGTRYIVTSYDEKKAQVTLRTVPLTIEPSSFNQGVIIKTMSINEAALYFKEVETLESIDFDEREYDRLKNEINKVKKDLDISLTAVNQALMADISAAAKRIIFTNALNILSNLGKIANDPRNSALISPRERFKAGKRVDLPYKMLVEMIEEQFIKAIVLFKKILIQEGITDFTFNVLDGLQSVGKGTQAETLKIVTNLITKPENKSKLQKLGITQDIVELHTTHVAKDFLHANSGTKGAFAPNGVEPYQSTYGSSIVPIVNGAVAEGLMVDDKITMTVVLYETILRIYEAKEKGKCTNGITWDVVPRTNGQYEFTRQIIEVLNSNNNSEEQKIHANLETALVVGLNDIEATAVNDNRDKAAKAAKITAGTLKEANIDKEFLEPNGFNDSFIKYWNQTFNLGLNEEIMELKTPQDIQTVKEALKDKITDIESFSKDYTAKYVKWLRNILNISEDWPYTKDDSYYYLLLTTKEIGISLERIILRLAQDPRSDDARIKAVLNRFRSHFAGRADYLNNIQTIIAGGGDPRNAIIQTIEAKLGGKDTNATKRYKTFCGIVNELVVKGEKDITLEGVIELLDQELISQEA